MCWNHSKKALATALQTGTGDSPRLWPSIVKKIVNMGPKKTMYTISAGACTSILYAIRVTQRSATNGSEVLSVECLFCVYFGCEAKVAQRACTRNVKYCTRPFRTGNYKQHHEHWAEYQAATDDIKKVFFEQSQPIRGHFMATSKASKSPNSLPLMLQL